VGQRGYLYLVSGLALAPTSRQGNNAVSQGAVPARLTAKHELRDVVGTAYAVEALAWLAAQPRAIRAPPRG